MLCGMFNITVYVFSYKGHKFILLYCKLAGSGIMNMYIYEMKVHCGKVECPCKYALLRVLI